MPAFVDITAASIPKQGHRSDENEDAWAARSSSSRVQACVADGATESVYARLWAQSLVQAFVERVVADEHVTDEAGAPHRRVSGAHASKHLHETVPSAREAWSEAVDAKTGTVPWYVEAKQRQGAFATVLGLLLTHSAPGDSNSAEAGRFAAVSVGDCGLFQYGEHERKASTAQSEPQWVWPESDPDAFTNRPHLVSSRPGEKPAGNHASDSAGVVRTVDGTWQMGDTFVIATDAVAAWLLREKPRLPASDAEADEQLREAQSSGRLRNDDSTIVIFRTHPA